MESCHTCVCGMSRVRIRHVTHRMDGKYGQCVDVPLDDEQRLSHVTRISTSCHVSEYVMSHM